MNTPSLEILESVETPIGLLCLRRRDLQWIRVEVTP